MIVRPRQTRAAAGTDLASASLPFSFRRQPDAAATLFAMASSDAVVLALPAAPARDGCQPPNPAAEKELDALAPAHDSAPQQAALHRLGQLVQAWAGDGVPVRLLLAGSFALNVHCAAADVDVLVVLPAGVVTRQRVFEELVPWLAAARGVHGVVPLPSARVPIVSLCLDGVDMDVLTAHLAEVPTPEELLASYRWTLGADAASVASCGGPRVTAVIARTAATLRPSHFRKAVRVLRAWAAARHVYGNALGFFGGVNLALLLLYVALRAPRADAPALVQRFFATWAAWDWAQQPVGFMGEGDAGLASARPPAWLREADSAGLASAAAAPMVLLTPCFPRTNTLHTATLHTARVLREELAAGHAAASAGRWCDLLAPPPAVVRCTRFIRVTVGCGGAAGLIEARVRHLVAALTEDLLGARTTRQSSVWVDLGPAVGRATFIAAPLARGSRARAPPADLGRALQDFVTGRLPAGGVGDSSIAVEVVHGAWDAVRLGGGEAAAPAPTPAPPRPARPAVALLPAVSTLPPPPPPSRASAPCHKRVLTVVALGSRAPRLQPRRTQVVRPIVRRGLVVTPFDQYVDRAAHLAGVDFPGSLWAHAAQLAGCPTAFAAWLAHDALRPALLALAGRTLACFCIDGGRGERWCHGRVLAAAADAAAGCQPTTAYTHLK